MDRFEAGRYAFDIGPAGPDPQEIWLVSWTNENVNDLPWDEAIKLEQAAMAVARQRHPGKSGVIQIVTSQRGRTDTLD